MAPYWRNTVRACFSTARSSPLSHASSSSNALHCAKKNESMPESLRFFWPSVFMSSRKNWYSPSTRMRGRRPVASRAGGSSRTDAHTSIARRTATRSARSSKPGATAHLNRRRKHSRAKPEETTTRIELGFTPCSSNRAHRRTSTSVFPLRVGPSTFAMRPAYPASSSIIAHAPSRDELPSSGIELARRSVLVHRLPQGAVYLELHIGHAVLGLPFLLG